MLPILGRYGSFFLYSYTVVLAAGIGLALALTWRLGRGQERLRWVDGVLIAALGGLLFGRLVFVGLNPAYFSENPHLTWQIWEGGLNYQAVAAGGMISFWLWTRLTGRPFAEVAALIAPGLALLVTAAWAACWFEGCAYGQEVSSGFLTAPLPDEFGVVANRYQTQAAGFALASAIVVLAMVLHRRGNPAVTVLVTLVALALADGLIFFFKHQSGPTVSGVNLTLALDGVVFVVGSIIIAILAMRNLKQTISSNGN